MKEERREQMLSALRKSNVIRNNGRGDLFWYVEHQGIWKKGKGVAVRKAIAEQLVIAGIKSTVSELRDLESEIREDVDFTEEALNQAPSPCWIVDNAGRVNIVTLEREPFRRDAYDKIALDFKFEKTISAIPSSVADFLTSSLGVQKADMAESPTTQLFLKLSELQRAICGV